MLLFNTVSKECFTKFTNNQSLFFNLNIRDNKIVGIALTIFAVLAAIVGFLIYRRDKFFGKSTVIDLPQKKQIEMPLNQDFPNPRDIEKVVLSSPVEVKKIEEIQEELPFHKNDLTEKNEKIDDRKEPETLEELTPPPPTTIPAKPVNTYL